MRGTKNLMSARLQSRVGRKATPASSIQMARSKSHSSRLLLTGRTNATKFSFVQNRTCFIGHEVPGKKLAFYAALLYRRATQSRSFAGNNWEKILQELRQSATDNQLVKELAECLGKRLNTPVSTEAMQNAILEWIKQAQTPAVASNSFLSDLLEMTEYIASLLLKKEPWRILRPPDGEQFVTTDNPLITFVPIGNGLLHAGYGFRKEEAVAAFPLAPEACLVMGNAWSVPTTLDTGSLTSLNQALITICDRYTYSKTLSEQIQETVQKCAGICRYGVNALMPAGLNMPTAQQFLRMKFCGDLNN
jgi:hypothetical protein